MKKNLVQLIALMAIVFSMTFMSCNDETTDINKTGIDSLIAVGELNGNLDHAVTLTSSVYKLTGTFIIEDGGSLTIPAGTKIEASAGFGSYIMVAQGGKIYINGTSSAPVVMTSNNENKDLSSGYWGGLIINGKAKISGASDVAAPTYACEMNTDYMYGGSDDTDNSGSITYLEIKYAGARSTADIEHNGLTLDAVGNGTTIHDIYILESADDGIECFGGCVNISNVLVVNQDDDCFDNTQGYRGTWTNMYGIWEAGYTSSESDPRGVESDGNMDGNSPKDINQTDFIIKNMTIDLKLAYDTTSQATYMQDIIKIRRGATANVTNALVKGVGGAQDLIDMSDSKGAGNVNSSISLFSSLTNPIMKSGVEVRPGYTTNSDGTKTYLSYPKVAISTTANTGCDKTLFSWTGYTDF